MKVAFWRGVGNSPGVTENMAAISVILALQYKTEVVLSSNYVSSFMLQDCFLWGRTECKEDKASYCCIYGEADYFRKLWELKKHRRGLIAEIPIEGVTIVFPPDVADRQMFYYEVPEQKLSFMDVAGEHTLASRNALEEADMVAVFLPQNTNEIQKFFNRYYSLIPKALFFMDDFRKGGECIPRNLAVKYGINRNCIGVIPHSDDFRQACDEGKVERFLKGNMNCSTQNPNFYFMSNMQLAAQMIYERYCKKRREEVRYE